MNITDEMVEAGARVLCRFGTSFPTPEVTEDWVNSRWRRFEEETRLALTAALAASPIQGEPVTLTYSNWRGETAERTIRPLRVWYGSTDWHPEPQWLVTAIDTEKNAERDFALKDFGAHPVGEERLREENKRLRKVLEEMRPHIEKLERCVRVNDEMGRVVVGQTEAATELAAIFARAALAGKEGA